MHSKCDAVVAWVVSRLFNCDVIDFKCFTCVYFTVVILRITLHIASESLQRHVANVSTLKEWYVQWIDLLIN